MIQTPENILIILNKNKKILEEKQHIIENNYEIFKDYDKTILLKLSELKQHKYLKYLEVIIDFNNIRIMINNIFLIIIKNFNILVIKLIN